MRKTVISICVIALVLSIASGSFARGAPLPAQTIVPQESRISDHEARLALARILSYGDKDLEGSLAQYRVLLKEVPGDTGVLIETSGVLARLKMFKDARALLSSVLAKEKGNADVLTSIADIECELGHAKTCRDHYLRALELSQDPSIRTRFADRLNSWGDFYGAESLYRERLASHPDDRQTYLKLARTLASSQRYEEAEGIYKKLIFDGHGDAVVLLGYAELKFLERDFDASSKYAARALEADPLSEGGKRILAGSMVYRGDYAAARGIYQEIAAREPGSPRPFIDIGKVFLKENEHERAHEYFARAYRADREDPASLFFYNWPRSVRTREFISSTVVSENASSSDLVLWAGLFVEQGHYDEAIGIYRAALDRDPEYFPASIGLAEALSYDRRYDESIRLYQELAEDFPGNSKILIGLARVLGWSKQYDRSIALYQRITALNPADPVPRREMARTAMWGKLPSLSVTTYEEVLSPSVDSKLLERLRAIDNIDDDREMEGAYRRLSEAVSRGSIYEGYEGFKEVLDTRDTGPVSRRAEEPMIELYPDYRIQRSFFLEKEAKDLSYNKRFARSLPLYESLLDVEPGNQEAHFDRAQALCALSLCREEGKAYERLLGIDASHSLARDALERQKLRGNPSLRFDYSYWKEEGRGDLARITRNRFDLTFNMPIECQYGLSVSAHRWLEHPDFTNRTYGASGFSLGLAGAFNPFVKAQTSWTHKRYDTTGLKARDSGHGTLWFNIYDIFRLETGYARTDELYNYFGLKQGVQADRLWAAFQSDITRKFEVGGRAEYIRYTDSNEGSFFGLSAGYAFTDHPRIFKVTLSGEFRNTLHDNDYVYRADTLSDIIHPYWTPRNYSAGSITFQWRHDLSNVFICGGEQHYYDVKTSFGTDSENNPYARLEAHWSYEFKKHWRTGIKGMVHSSPEWNATGVWATLGYRF